MKRVLKYVYYCDFCNKRTLSGGSINTHEKHCTNNPNRVCRICEGVDIAGLVKKYKAAFVLHDNNLEMAEQTGCFDSHIVDWVGHPITMEKVRKDCGECPNCMLSLLRQSGLNRHYFSGFEFDYKEELAEWMKEKNAESE